MALPVLKTQLINIIPHEINFTRQLLQVLGMFVFNAEFKRLHLVMLNLEVRYFNTGGWKRSWALNRECLMLCCALIASAHPCRAHPQMGIRTAAPYIPALNGGVLRRTG